ncbi:hypothetical protein Trydic_g21436 [Trypoxylus dichotomus]
MCLDLALQQLSLALAVTPKLYGFMESSQNFLTTTIPGVQQIKPYIEPLYYRLDNVVVAYHHSLPDQDIVPQHRLNKQPTTLSPHRKNQSVHFH